MQKRLLTHKIIYSARKIVHSKEYIQLHPKIKKIPKNQQKKKKTTTLIYSGNKQLSTIYKGVLGFACGTTAALLHRLGKQAPSLFLALAYIGQTPPHFWAIPFTCKNDI